MIKNVSDLIRFDFTSDCKTCEFKKELNEFEYCCSFVYEQIKQDYLYELKKHIIDYIFLDDIIEKIDYENIFFTDETTYAVMITFKTNLKQDKELILNELVKAMLKTKYFKNINFLKDSLYMKNNNNDIELLN